ncbi:MAG: site-specific DNA-methyltransferase [bacterium]
MSNHGSRHKRDRKTSSSYMNVELFEEAGKDRIEAKAPTKDDPALRRFIPNPAGDPDARLSRLGILDWRKNPLDDRLADIEEVADRIICADAEQALKSLPDESVNCIITSPPYWNVIDYGFQGQLGFCDYDEYLMQLLRVWRECERVLCPNGKLCIEAPVMPISKKVLANQHTRHLKNINNDIEAVILKHLDLERFSLYIWQKQTTEKMFGSYPYPPNLYEQNTIEFINVFVKKGKPRRIEKEIKEESRVTEKEWMDLTRQVWPLYPEDVKRATHPAPFPESVPNRLITMYTFAKFEADDKRFPGDIVLDPFNGTGATCAAAKRMKRRFIGIDLSPQFCISAQQRLDKCLPDKKIFLIKNKNKENKSQSVKTGPGFDSTQGKVKSSNL